METLLHIVQTINFYLSDYILVVLLVGTGVFFLPSHPLCPGPLLWGGHAPGFRRLLHARGPAEGRPEFLSGPDHRHCRPGGHRQYHRLLQRHPGGGGPVPSSGCGSSLFSGCPPFTPRPFWPRRLGWSMRTAPSPAALFTTLSGLFRTSSALSWRGSLRWPSPWPWALSAVWFSPTPSVRPAATLSASPLGS